MIKTDKKHLRLGHFESEVEAALAYNKAARENFGDDGYQNEIHSDRDQLRRFENPYVSARSKS